MLVLHALHKMQSLSGFSPEIEAFLISSVWIHVQVSSACVTRAARASDNTASWSSNTKSLSVRNAPEDLWSFDVCVVLFALNAKPEPFVIIAPLEH